MKKVMSLFLALVLSLGVLAGISFAADKPTECIPEQAAVIVTHAAEETAKYYFDTLSSNVIQWACQGLEGDTTITLAQDIVLDPKTATNYFVIPYEKGGWYNSKPDDKTLILDLGGKTLTCECDSYLFSIKRYGMTVKNGTIDYSGTKGVFVLGTTKGQTAIKDGSTQYKPILNLENVHVYQNGTAANSYAIANYIYGSTVNVKDSLLWTAKNPTIFMSKTDQSDLGNFSEYKKPANLKLNVENSTIISGGNFSISLGSKVDLTSDKAAITVKNTALVSNKDTAVSELTASVMNTDGKEPTKQDFSQFLNNGITATGTSYTYGVVAGEVKLPFTDVAENAWYYTFVRDLYAAKVISGMTETTFVPEGTLTYGQALKLVTLAVGGAEQAPTDSHWASGYMNNALANGWMYEEVGLDTKITRLQFCQIAATAAGIVKQPESNPFTDTADASVLGLYNAGIINGMTETTFAPNGLLTRAQISKIIFGIISK